MKTFLLVCCFLYGAAALALAVMATIDKEYGVATVGGLNVLLSALNVVRIIQVG